MLLSFSKSKAQNSEYGITPFFCKKKKNEYTFLFAYIEVKIFWKETQQPLKGTLGMDGDKGGSNFSL